MGEVQTVALQTHVCNETPKLHKLPQTEKL